MKVKKIWTDVNFEEMGWHDGTVYSTTFPSSENPVFSLDIDYIFSWILDEKDGLYSFMISPCTLIFDNVLFLKLNFDFQNRIGVIIQDIKRENPTLSPNGKFTIWDYCIESDIGTISFQTTGYSMIVRKQPVLSKSQALFR